MLKRFCVLFMLLLLIPLAQTFAQQTSETEKPTTLPSDGGEPGKAYMAYTKAFTAGDVEALKKMVTADRAKQLDDPQMKQMLPMMRSLQAKNIKVTGGTMTSKDATLNLEGQNETGGKQTGTVHMVLENKVWKVEKESWKSGM